MLDSLLKKLMIFIETKKLENDNDLAIFHFPFCFLKKFKKEWSGKWNMPRKTFSFSILFFNIKKLKRNEVENETYQKYQ